MKNPQTVRETPFSLRPNLLILHYEIAFVNGIRKPTFSTLMACFINRQLGPIWCAYSGKLRIMPPVTWDNFFCATTDNNPAGNPENLKQNATRCYISTSAIPKRPFMVQVL